MLHRQPKLATPKAELEVLNLLDWAKPNYQRIWDFQKSLVEEIASGQRPESLIFCEHETVITAGRRAKSENLLPQNPHASVSVYPIERGGDVTLHNPGQLVMYPLLHLKGERFPGGLHEYLRWLEQITINVLCDLGLDAGRFGPTGVWIKDLSSGEHKKIASIGIAVRRWVTYHGLALNVSNDLSDFGRIRPCDFDSQIMTSLEQQGLEVSISQLVERFKNQITEA